MHFVNPLYLFGLLAIAIPVVIHLFNFRRFRKVYFTNVRFLQALRQQTRKQSQLRQLLILAARVLAIASLVLAFAQPYIPFAGSKSRMASQQVVSVFVDNSFSMEAQGRNGMLLDEAKEKAREIVSAYKASDLFQLLTCDFEGRHQRLVSRDEFLNMLDEVKISPSTHTFSEIINRQYDLLKNEKAARLSTYLVSDFQKSAFASPVIKPDTGISTYLVPLPTTAADNVYIDTCWFTQPLQLAGKTTTISARVWNKSAKDLEKIPLKLEINGQQKAVATLDIKAGMSAIAEMPFTVRGDGPQHGVLQLTDYPVTYDDKFYFAFDIQSAVSVLSINGAGSNRFLDVLYAQDSTVRMLNVSEKLLDYGRLGNTDLIILNEIPSLSSGLADELKRFVNNGGTLLILPATQPDLVSYNQFLAMVYAPLYQKLDTARTKVTRLSEDSYLFRDVFEKQAGRDAVQTNTELPKVFKYFPILFSTATLTVPLMELVNGGSFLTLTNSGMGQVIQSCVPLDPSFSNFPYQAVFVPVLYNIAMISHPTHPLYSIIGDNKGIQAGIHAPAGDQVYKIKSLDSDFEMIPQVTPLGNVVNIFVGNQVPMAGNFELLNDNKVITALAFNYNRGESDLQCFTGSELESMLEKAHLNNFNILETGQKPLNETITQMNSGTRLWKYFVWLALLMLLAEILLIRFLKK